MKFVTLEQVLPKEMSEIWEKKTRGIKSKVRLCSRTENVKS